MAARPDILDAAGLATGAAGDVPDALRRRYLTDPRGGRGLGFYTDALTITPAFRDQGRRLTALRNDPQVIRDLVAIARHRGWSAVRVSGETGFRREIWLTASLGGLAVAGYRPSARDLQALERLQPRHPEHPDGAGTPMPPEASRRLAEIEAVVRSRIVEPATQARLMAGARQRIAAWLERGATFASPDRDKRPADRER